MPFKCTPGPGEDAKRWSLIVKRTRQAMDHDNDVSPQPTERKRRRHWSGQNIQMGACVSNSETWGEEKCIRSAVRNEWPQTALYCCEIYNRTHAGDLLPTKCSVLINTEANQSPAV